MASNYRDLEDYGIIGNLETCALVSKYGSIDWLCFPFLESPSVFGALLDSDRGGHFQVTPVTKFVSSQSYIENTNILQTSFSTPFGIGLVTDFMPVKGREDVYPVRSVLRKVECTSKQVAFTVSFKPRFDYARVSPGFEVNDNGIIARSQDDTLFLQCPFPLEIHDGAAVGKTDLKEGECVWLILVYDLIATLPDRDCRQLLKRTMKYWQDWARSGDSGRKNVYAPEWRDLAVRSGLVLKLLTNPDTGAIAAAATTSLPERIGGDRNWDYRFAWIRDSSFTIQAYFHLGHLEESRDFRKWNGQILGKTKDPSQILVLYGLHGETDLRERKLPRLSGYKGSKPVRIGNSAAKQTQLDIYGELLNAIYDMARYEGEISEDIEQIVQNIVEYVCQAWKRKDSSIWEIRGQRQHFVYSKLMCWVAIDRAIKIRRLRRNAGNLDRWQKAREEIRRAIIEKGFNREMNSFVQSFGSEIIDATGLLIPLNEFLPPGDPRVQGTIDAIMSKLMTKDGLVYRNMVGDRPPEEGAFLPCSFWLVKALAISKRVDEAERIFRNVLNYVSPLGLVSEEVHPETDKLLGNFPQAFSHIGIINSALYIGIERGRRYEGPKPLGAT